MSLQISDEMINAFIDDELDQQDRLAIKQAMEQDAELRIRIDNLCTLKKSIQQSYQQLPLPENPSVSARRLSGHWMQYAAVVIVMAFGLVFGWMARGEFGVVEYGVDYAGALQLNDQVQEQLSKVILHVSSSEPKRLERTLHQISVIIDKYTRHQMDFEIEVVVNARGIDLLREDVSPYGKQITDVMDQYQNVSFIACNNAIDRLRQRGIEPKLINRTRTGVTAVEQIVKRLQQGWVYMKV